MLGGKIYMTRPLILDFSIPRINENKKLPYFYDAKQNLNVIDVDGSLCPFINADDILLATITKTSIPSEITDDDEMATDRRRENEGLNLTKKCLEIETNTRKHREGNDNNYLELFTKTDASIESDDDL